MPLFSYFEKKYWLMGFKSRLYDWLTPEAYHYTLERALEHVPRNPGKTWLDAGCGSGILIKYIKDQLLAGDRYIGTDLLDAGLQSARRKADAENVSHRSVFFRSDLGDLLPFEEESVDVVVAYFSIYTIKDPEKRVQAFKNLRGALRPGGFLILVSPSSGYNGKRIIKTSVDLLKRRGLEHISWTRQWLLYPLTLSLGLKFVERQLKKNHWHGYELDELCEEVRAGGFRIKSTESVYAQSAFLVVAS